MGVLNIPIGYVFIHVPKAAGSSIVSVLRQSKGAVRFADVPGLADVVRLENEVSAEKVARTEHARARDIRAALEPGLYQQLKSVAVVRNPWDRLRSRFLYLRATRAERGPLPEHLAGSFNDFVLWACASRPNTLSERLADRNGSVIVTNIMRFESLERDFEQMAAAVFRTDLKLPLLNVSTRPVPDEPYRRETIEAVQGAYESDFRLFGYPDTP